VVVPESIESSCLGAAVLGLYAIGKTDSLAIVSTMVGATHVHKPIKENADIYHQLLPIFIGISRKLEDEYEAIAKFQQQFDT
jgi:gluconokinase